MRAARRWTESELREVQGAVLRNQRLESLHAGADLAALSTRAEPETQLAKDVRAMLVLEHVRAERNKLVSHLDQQMRLAGVRALFITEHRFALHLKRQFAFDFFAGQYQLGIEVHGGIYKQGRHNTGSGFARDRTKMNLAIECGITVLEYPAEPVKSGDALCQILRVLEARGWKAST